MTDAKGQVTFAVHDTTAEVVTFTVTDTTDDFTLAATATLTFVTTGLPDPRQSTIGANPMNVPNDGKTASTVTVTLNDHGGNAIPGKTISLTASGGTSVIAPLSPTTNTLGQATFAVTDSAAEIVTYTATDTTDENLSLGGQGVAVTFGSPPPPLPTIADSDIIAGGTAAPADGKTTVAIAVLLHDANGLPVAGKTVALNPSGGTSVVTTVVGTTAADGEADFTVADSKAETVSYSATDTTDQLPITGQSVTVTFTTPTTAAATSTSTTPTTSAAPGGTPAAASAATTGNTGTGGSQAATAADNSSSATSGTGATLALTGPPSSLPWLFGLGMFLFLVGALGRRVSHVKA